MALHSGLRRWRPCCAWSYDVELQIPDDSADPLGHDLMHELRAHMLTGNHHAGCVSCYRDEAAVGHSMRMQFNQEQGRLADHVLTYVEFNFGNLCNFKCRMCNSGSSSRWIADEIAQGMPKRELVRRAAVDFRFDITKIQRMKFIGGEPSLEQENIKHLLHEVESRGIGIQNLDVEVITNGYVRFDDELISMLRRCQRVMFQVSMDGLGRSNDYQRFGSEWDVVSDNAAYYHSLTDQNWQLMIASSIGIFTILDVVGFMQWVLDELPYAKHIVQLIDWPKQQRICNLPDICKQRLIDRLDHWLPPARDIPAWLPFGVSSPQLMSGMLRYGLSQQAASTVDEVIKHVELLDSYNGQKLAEHIPELYEIFYDARGKHI